MIEEADIPSGKTLRVVLVEPLPVVRAGMAMLIASRPGFEVVGETGTSDETLGLLEGLEDTDDVVVLVWLGLAGEHDAYWLMRKLRELFPAITALGCGAHADQASISRVLYVGADGFVDKNAPPDQFLDGLAAAAGGQIVLVGPPAEWIGSIAEGIGRQRDYEPVLSERELQVLSIASEGVTAREIASRLGLAERTVTTHLTRIYGKLGVNGRVAALAYATKADLFGSSTGG